MTPNGDPTLTAGGAEFDDVVFDAGTPAAHPKALEFRVPENDVPVTDAELIDGSLGDLAFHTDVIRLSESTPIGGKVGRGNQMATTEANIGDGVRLFERLKTKEKM